MVLLPRGKMKTNLVLVVTSVFYLSDKTLGVSSPRQNDAYTARRVAGSANLVPVRQFCCGYNQATCAQQCTGMNLNGYCCTAFSVLADGSCSLYDYGPEFFEPIPAGDTMSQKYFQRAGFQTCWVAIIAGGYNGGSIPNVELFSPNGLCNQPLANLPLQLYANFYIGSYQGKIFTCMGFNTQSIGDIRNCYQYNISTDTWSFMTASTYFHRWKPGLIYQNKLHFIDNPNPETFNLDTNQWSAGITVPSATGENPCIVNYLDTLIIIGGSSYPTGMQQFNFTNNTWSYLPSLSPGYSYFGCTLLPASSDAPVSALLFTDRILMMQSQSSDVLGTIYGISSSQFLPIPPTTYGHRHNQILALGRRVFVFAGYNGAPHNIVEEYHQHNNSWTVVPTRLLNSRYHPSATVVPAHWFKNIPGGCQGII